MSAHHHPSDETLLSYGAGALGEAFAVVVAAHVEACRGCADKVAAAEAAGGAMLEELPPQDLSDESLAHTLARLDAPARVAPKPMPSVLDGVELPRSLRGYALGRWHVIAPGLRWMELLPRDRKRAGLRLIRVRPGMALPRHGHQGNEMTCILAGGFSDESGHYGLHDIDEQDASGEHQPRAEGNEDCVCLVASDAPMRFNGLFARFVQRLTGF